MEKTTNISNEESSKKTFRERCEGMGLNYEKTCEIKSKYNLTDDQALTVAFLKI